MTFSLQVPIAIILLLLLLISSAMISGAEVAFFSLGSKDLDDLRNEKSKTAYRILHLRSISRRLLATILITNSLVNIGIVIVSAYLLSQVIPFETFLQWARSVQQLSIMRDAPLERMAVIFSFILTVAMVSFILVLFGEVVPRVYAKLNNVQFARFMALPLQVMVNVLSPLGNVLSGWSRRIESWLQRRGNGGSSDAAIKEDIDKAIDLAMPRDANSRLEAGILKSIIKFNDVPVKQIMRSRVDMVSIDDQIPFTKLKEIVRTEGYSRMPVYHDHLDNILGILYVKDLIGNMEHGDEFAWQDLILKQVLYVPELKKINELLKEFQKEHMHMGIVIDEYGGTAGLVTLEDVMEEVIGEIKDEFDDAVDGDYRKIDQHTYLFEGKVLLNDVCRIIGVDSSILDDIRGDADSLAGLILELSGRMPERGEEYTVAGISFTVISVSSRRIEKIRVRLQESSQ